MEEVFVYEFEIEESGLVGTAPAISNGKLYMGAGDGILYCFGLTPDLEITSITGGLFQSLWRRSLPPFQSPRLL